MMKKITDTLFSTRAAGIYMLLFAIAIGAATFIENDFGTSSAQKVVFKARWFELLLILFGITILVNIRRFRMIEQKKWALLTFHASIIVIIIGAGVTRYIGYEGIMHIREGSSSNEIITSETYLNFEATYKGDTYRFDERVHFATLGRNKFNRKYQIEDKVLEVNLRDFIPNPTRELVSSDDGVPMLKLVIAGNKGREEHYLKYGDLIRVGDNWFNFNGDVKDFAINMDWRNDSLVLNTPMPMTQMVMATQSQTPIPANQDQMLLPRALYSNDAVHFVLADFREDAVTQMTSTDPKMRNESIASLEMEVSAGDETKTTYVYGNKGMEGQPSVVEAGDVTLSVSYGAKRIQLPFQIALRDFIMERYPGTNSASSYASEVTLIDPNANLREDNRIYMNHILDYKGYRFFQSSFDQDELGTVLSVNHDFWGTWISYLGYFLLTVGLLMNFLSRKSRFQFLSRQLGKMRSPAATTAGATVIALFLFATPARLSADAAPVVQGDNISLTHADQLGRLVVQDHKGRLKPFNTLASEVLRKVSRKEELYGMNPDQVMIGMMVNSQEWYEVPMIKLGKHEKLAQMFGEGSHAAYADFFDQEGRYVLQEYVRTAYARESIDRNKFDKEIMKIDERVNICNMIFSGRLMRLYPLPDDPNNRWLAPGEIQHGSMGADENEFIRKWYLAYVQTAKSAIESGDWAVPGELISELHRYQETYGGDIMISDATVNLDIFLNDLRPFSRLSKFYGLLGLLFLGVFFTSIFNHKISLKWPLRVSLGLLGAAFVLHTVGLGLRWYVSGHAPWSNGYESMIYIAWTTILAGLIFSRKSIGGLAATSILSSTILMVAGLSWLDPEITPLVPVLKSYWLTIHVSLEAGSYGFLALGAIIGILNLVSMIFLNNNNKDQIHRVIKEMSYVSEMTLIGGLVMISVGTYLGGVWANESWGRYWGWDAKETWALVTILVYAFILHMRLIPGLQSKYAFNVSTLFGFASVMMTYFGVNYYLSGLHSYAAGDPVPVPTFVYYTVGAFVVISLLAYWKYRQFKPGA